MKKKSNLLTCIGKAIISGFLIIGMFTALSAQEILEKSPDKPSASPQVPYSKQAKTTPVSKSKIRLKLTFDGEPFEVSQFEGATIRIERNGSTYGLIPYLDGDQVQVKAVKMYVVKDGDEIIGEGVTELTDFEVSLNVPVAKASELGATIELLHIEKKNKAKKNANQPTLSLLDNCCLSCGGTTVCGCGVSGSCGSCCPQGCGCGANINKLQAVVKSSAFGHTP